MTGEEAIAYMESIPWTEHKPGLDRIRILLDGTGNPEKNLRFVHIAGTNGKGSTAAMTASILQEAGYKTGLYISPYLQFFEERMSINGVRITGEELGEITEKIKAVADTMEDSPTEFECMTAAAFLYYQNHGCDLVVLETGLGGRLDSTNIIPSPEAAVICNIGLDHVELLGDTLEKIAWEKAGIIKEGCEVVLYEPEDDHVFETVRMVCEEKHAHLHMTDFSALVSVSDTIDGQSFFYRGGDLLKIRLLGPHQLKNAAVVLEIVQVLRERGYSISQEALKKGLSQAVWPGRFEVLRKDPLFIADGGHNRQCAKAVAEALKKYFPDQKIRFILGVLKDKEYQEIIKLLLPIGECFYTVSPQSPRALPAKELADLLSGYGKRTVCCESAADAVNKALAEANRTDVICSVGSLYMTGEVRQTVLEQTN